MRHGPIPSLHACQRVGQLDLTKCQTQLDTQEKIEVNLTNQNSRTFFSANYLT